MIKGYLENLEKLVCFLVNGLYICMLRICFFNFMVKKIYFFKEINLKVIIVKFVISYLCSKNRWICF